ncbi:MAG: tRNA (adenosine(37)-N6)-threonylcarbamoyltransferase complex ATPase subunit type 1 TsaE [Patescibacteria group bacterium]
MFYKTKNVDETIELGKKIASDFKAGDIILLNGDLGAGKTALTKGIAKFFNIKKEITSPTFALMNIYEINNSEIKNLIHIDTYRLKNEDELLMIGVEDYLGDNETICLIEWPEKISNILKKLKTKIINIEHLDRDERKIEIK